MLAGVALLAFLSAVDPLTAPIEGLPVRAVIVQGNHRTRTSTIRYEIDTRPGMAFSRDRWRDDVQRVKDLGLFWTTDTTAATSPAGVKLYLTVEEKWTLIPLFGFDRAGDTTEWSGGLYEANFLGMNQHLGFRFARKEEGDTYSVFNSSERILGTEYSYQVELAEARSVHTAYDRRGLGDEPVRGYYEYRRTAFYLEFGRRFDRDGEFQVAGFFYTRRDRYARLDDTPERREINERTGFAAPPYRFTHRFGLTATLGKLHYNDYIYKGDRLDAYLMTSVQPSGSPRRFERLSLKYTSMAEPFPRHNAALRVLLGSSGSALLEDTFRIGGLSEVRGFPDERFTGQHLWLVNGEYRYPALDNRYVLGQLTGFMDAGRTWNGLFHESPIAQAAVSTGAGVRLIVKPIATMMVRFDYAYSLSPYRRTGYNLGITQFF